LNNSSLDHEIAQTNEKLDKLLTALKNRLYEIEEQDSDTEDLSETYSYLYAYAEKVLLNNDDPNYLLIIQKIIEDY
jgi:hypothetical protein